MKGVLYKYCNKHKINGTVYYAFEYFMFLYSFDKNIKFYVIDLDTTGRELFIKMFKDKYLIDEVVFDNIVSIKRSQIFGLHLKQTLILDIRTFETIKFFLTGTIHCFSNESHENYKGTKNYQVIYYGSYKYQLFDKFCYLKLNFNIFKPIKNIITNKVFISSGIPPKQIDYSIFKTEKQIYKKEDSSIVNNLFSEIDEVIYYHVKLDTNNRIIPEAFFYNKIITIEEGTWIVDSTILRYQDILKNGLKNYTLDGNDIMIKGMLDEN